MKIKKIIIKQVNFMEKINEKITKSGIKVTIHLPEKVTENIKQLKINRLYDILKPKEKNIE